MTTTSTPPLSRNTAAFYAQAAIAFGVSLGGAGLGIAYLPVDAWQRAFLAMTLLFVVTSAFTLAKCVRDQQEVNTVRVRVDEARVEKLIAEHDPYKVSAR